MKTVRRIIIVFLVVAVAGFALPESMPFGVDQSYAQQTKGKRKNLFELLFGKALKQQRERKKRAAAKRAAKQAKKKVKQKNSSSTTASRTTRRKTARKTAAAAPAVKVVEKNEDAAKVLVIGDFMAGQLALGLEQMFAENPGLVTVDKSVALSGLVRDDVQNWPSVIGDLIEETKPIVVVTLVGMNDRQQMRTQGGRLAKLSDPWKAEYKQRVDGLAEAVRSKRLPMIWVGLPPVSKNSMNADYLVFNEYYRTAVESAGGAFVDVWQGFVDEEGRYVRSGPNINGQIVSLRRSDGINMTASGYEKLAFFTEKAIKRMTGFGKDALVSSLVSVGLPDGFKQDQYDPAGTGKTVVIALGNPAADGANALEGGEGFLTASDARQSTSFELVAKGLGTSPKDGRIDSAWGKPSFSLPKGETPEPVLANIRGISLKSYLDEPAPALEGAVEQGAETGGEPKTN
ncbi:SGNH/GDSL hydrolase family protein [Salaquimonas pukyongi]|uniref:SGNH/GDSL hydrolase family protein n=1 Tax=Salaquimonas pukyongi TaxID=2712698 RepID=UPI00096BAAC7|nr:SGNH family hydrolase [Salaquimonas pukyongi]